ncbi:GatB/YqeY domain-containing protein [Chitinivibrio alkaliphilus]|uniref:GatB/YqeY domain-containing protein n=1 Tax=Chitinivibrio alkaliphilus ACht1 TaxID=1313304 RepID=U7D8U7_9BACT|nr:GatB/YqeY domain-containing protein [Chitinivibrio alkaliphilus]ERP32006.1 GatB/YqeY domain-containing protein [Chitinivibrio alkaliphilus ACht1]
MIDLLQNEIRAAMRAKDKRRLTVLRSLMSSVKNNAIDAGVSDPTDADLLECVTKGIKQRKESAAEYRSAGRDDLADKEEYEISILEEFQPQQLSSHELQELIDAAVSQTGATEMSDMGKVLGVLMPQVKGKADGAEVSQMVRQRLS